MTAKKIMRVGKALAFPSKKQSKKLTGLADAYSESTAKRETRSRFTEGNSVPEKNRGEWLEESRKRERPIFEKAVTRIALSKAMDAIGIGYESTGMQKRERIHKAMRQVLEINSSGHSQNRANKMNRLYEKIKKEIGSAKTKLLFMKMNSIAGKLEKSQ